MKLTQPTKKKEIKRKWHLFDVKEKILGRVATQIAQKLMGKDKPYYVPYLDCGDYVVVINARQVRVTGRKARQKVYTHYSGYPGGLKKKTFLELQKENPCLLIKRAVSGMLPKNKLRASFLKRLYIFPEENHPFKDKF